MKPVPTIADAHTLRFGIFCNGTTFPAWEARCIENLLNIEGAKPVLLIIDGEKLPQPTVKEKIRRIVAEKAFLWRLYDRKILHRRSQATQSVDMADRLKDVPAIICEAEQIGKHTQHFCKSDLDEIAKHKLDFALRFGFGIIRGEILDVPKYGVWSFHHDDPQKYRGSPPGFWEIYNRDPVTGAILQRLTDRLDGGIVLQKGFFKTNPVSYVASRDLTFFGGAHWVAKTCIDIMNNNATYLDAPQTPTQASIFKSPTNCQMIRFFARWLYTCLQAQFVSFFRHQQWSVAIVDAPIHHALGLINDGSQKQAIRTARWISELPGRFLADPFGFDCAKSDRGLVILAEDFDWANGRGHISALESTDGETFAKARPIIKLDCHMSYPFIFQHEGSLYCVPETNEASSVFLFQADEQRSQWIQVATLVTDFKAVDSTIFQHGGYWWLFCTNEDNLPNTNLYAWHAPTLHGPWTAHATNPIKTDVRSSRPAGTAFVHEGRLYRPAQDCSTGYGAGIAVNRINLLTPHAFSEDPVSMCTPDLEGPYPIGLHTACALGDRTIIDGARYAFVPSAFRAACARKTRHLLRYFS